MQLAHHGAVPEQGLLVSHNQWLVGVGLALAMALGFQTLGSPNDCLVGGSIALVCLGSSVAFRLARSRSVMHVVVVALTFVFVAAVAVGLTEYLAWLGVVLLVAFLGLGSRGGAAWTFAMLLLTTVTLLWPQAQLGPAAPAPQSARNLRLVGLVPTLGAVAFMYELQRRQNIRQLRLAMEARSRLLAHVSHEMRTPLNGVLGLTQALQLETLPAGVGDHLRTIEHSGETLLALINDLLDVARAEAGTVEFASHPFDLRRVVDLTVALHQPRAASAGVALTVELPDEAVAVAGDAVRLQQVVGNLVANAIKHGGGSPVHVVLQTSQWEGRVRVTLAVRDSGPGLSETQQAKLFQPFVQLDPRTSPGGSGLGLFISRSLARGLGGELDLSSAPGAGSTFTLRLSLPTATLEAPSRATPALSFSGRVLVVGDNAVNLKVASALLAKLGVEVDTALDGEHALEHLEHHRIDLVLMDLQMPGMDGLETTRRLRSRGHQVPVVALTASAGAETREHCLRAGMVAVLVKPLRMEMLGSTLAQLLTT